MKRGRGRAAQPVGQAAPPGASPNQPAGRVAPPAAAAGLSAAGRRCCSSGRRG
jgi:hypothetical protein